MLSPWIRRSIVPPGSEAGLTSEAKLFAQPSSTCCTPVGFELRALVSVVAFSVRLPDRADADGVPLPVVAPVLTPSRACSTCPARSR